MKSKVKQFFVILTSLSLTLIFALPVITAAETADIEIGLANVSVEAACQYIAELDDVSDINTLKESVYYVQDGNLMRYDTMADSVSVMYEGGMDFSYYVPMEGRGVMLGTAAPTDSDGQDYMALSPASELSWDGEYYYYDYDTQELTEVEDPGYFLAVATMEGVTEVNMSTEIDDKPIPISAYPIGSTFNETVNGGTQCHGFGYKVFYELYSTYEGTKVDVNGALTSLSITKNYPTGTFIRANPSYGSENTRHTMIYIDSDSTGIYVYHANWYTDAHKNGVYIHHFTWAAFDELFPIIEYVRYHSHSFGSWVNHSTTEHIKSCTECGYSVKGTHTVSSSGVCTVCNYPVPVAYILPEE